MKQAKFSIGLAMSVAMTVVVTTLLGAWTYPDGDATAGGSTSNGLETGNNVAVTQVEQGQIAGYRESGAYIFKGIPYGKAERFMPPEKADKWDETRSCRAYGAVCPQGTSSSWWRDEMAFAFDWNDGWQNENCLTLNVWTAGINDGGKRPVMVWLHPGSYKSGSGHEMISFDGTNLAMHQDVVVVTLNHRLNELGYLDLSAYGEKYAHSANAGILDIVLALEWVRDNIASFGGDPDNVTIFGQSGGGGKVSTLMAMPIAKGLFHKAIVQSGSMIKAMNQKYSQMIAAFTLENLGLSPDEVDKLNDIPYQQLRDAGEKALLQAKPLAKEEGFNPFLFDWGPVVDGDILPFGPDSEEAMELSKDIPLIVGSTRNEFPSSVYYKKYRDPSEEVMLGFLKYFYGERTDEYIQAYKKAYGDDCSNKDLINLDKKFRPNALRQARLKSAHGGAPVYNYLFDWKSPVCDGFLTSIHCLDIPFVFDNVLRHITLTGGEEDALILGKKMSSVWANFARTGVPSAEDVPEWVPYTEENGATMIFGNDCRMGFNHDKELQEIVGGLSIDGI